MKQLKDRKTPLQSKSQLGIMLSLFENYVDEKAILIDIELGRIQTESNLYKVDIHTNKVEKILFERYKLEVNEPFD